MTTLAKIKFGTDGWRAVIARDYTFANLERVTQAYADYLLQNAGAGGTSLVVIGYDRRFLSSSLRSAPLKCWWETISPSLFLTKLPQRR